MCRVWIAVQKTLVFFEVSFFFNEINLPIGWSLPRKEVAEGKYMCS